MAKPPPLPPRNPPEISSLNDFPPASQPYRTGTGHLTPVHDPPEEAPPRYSPYSVGFDDPRTSSTQSLRPAESAGEFRRTLLLVYIHGFLGNETSFQSFPAHVHNVLTTTLAETHAVHSKIYPRYKSRKNISFARDDFSKWLAPHESPTTDVILVGHSLGGILAAEVALIPAESGQYQYRHRLLGIIAVDVPYLGMHPGVVSTGIASLFRSTPEDVEETVAPTSVAPTSPYSEMSTDPADPNFNPAFANDVRLTNRKGKAERAWYFWNKHWGELGKATKSYVTSHLEFGGCLADYPALRRRYDAVRGLEDIDDYAHPRSASGGFLRQVRFVNYYSASTGRVKERKVSPSASQEALSGPTQQMEHVTLNPEDSSATRFSSRRTPSPRISLEEHRDGQVVSKELEEEEPEVGDGPDYSDMDDAPLAVMDPRPLSQAMSDTETDANNRLSQTETSRTEASQTEISRTETSTSRDEFPPLAPLPDPPEELDGSRYTNPDALKLAQKEHAQKVKGFERAKKERDKTLRDREKLIQKREKAALKEQQKQEKEHMKRSATLNPDDYDKQLQSSAATAPVNPSIAAKKQKDRKFCSLPSKDPQTGKRDPTWVRVYMEGIDEVVAHTSMFKMSETYAKLVGDTVTRIEGWLDDDATKRAVLEGDD